MINFKMSEFFRQLTAEQQTNVKQDRQFTCDVTLRRVHTTIFAVEKQ